jgi:hypothetical protein
MKLLSCLVLVLALGAASAPCVQLDKQAYCLAWSHSGSDLDTWEYVRSGETVDNWKNLLTIQRFKVRAAFDDFIGAQNDQLLKSGGNPRWFKVANPIHDKEAGTYVKLTSGSDTEYTLFYFFQDTGQRIEGVIFSRHKALASGEPPSQAQLNTWVREMRAMSPP